MKVVLDTNVLIAAFVARTGRCAQLVERCAEAHEMVTSAPLLEEFRGKLVHKFRLGEDAADQRLAALESQMTVVAPAELPAPVSRDPDDDAVLATAVAGDCDCIVTGDQDLLVLRSYAGIPIISPGEFSAFESTR